MAPLPLLLLGAAALPSLLLQWPSATVVVDAQYVSRPLSSPCPPGADCVGRQLQRWLGPNATSIDCTSGANAAAFAGYLCAKPAGLANASFLLRECPSGYFCPDSATVRECPKGSWCHFASSSPTSQSAHAQAQEQGSRRSGCWNRASAAQRSGLALDKSSA